MRPEDEYRILDISRAPNSTQAGLRDFSKDAVVLSAHVSIWISILYFGFRLLCLIFGSSTAWMWAVLIAELALASDVLLWQLVTISAHKASRDQLKTPTLRLTGDHNLPIVDVLIPCCGEQLQYILDTVRAACVLDYPPDRFRVLVLDDGNSASLRKAVEELRTEWPNLHYHTRANTDRKGIGKKAGNLNYAILDLQEQMLQPPDFVANLDCDNIPSPDFLRATLPHLLRNPKVAVVGILQTFYNIPPDDPLDQGIWAYEAILLPQLTALGVIFAGGSGSVMRRSTVLGLGGLPMFSHLDDLAYSSIVTAMGQSVVVLPEVLQFGRAPTSVEGHASQRTWWSIGASQHLLALKNSPANTVPESARRSVAGMGAMHVYRVLARFLPMVVIPVALLSGQALIPGASVFLFKAQLLLAIAHLASLWGYDWLHMAATQFRAPLKWYQEDLWFIPGQVYAFFEHFILPKAASSAKSSVTGSMDNPWNAASSKTQAWLSRRIQEFASPVVCYNAAWLITTLSAMLYSFLLTGKEDNHRQLTTLAWPPVLHICYLIVSHNLVPLRYTWRPPRYRERKDVLGEHPRDSRALFPRLEMRTEMRYQRWPALGGYGHLALVPVTLIVLGLKGLAL
ncbi:glycosyltransferase family 2 protein [Aspergillus clavatus NRRL 1]|uniref:Glycosyl transferase, putative n=1 Tax=Aspergillus clavatus (strain ATCC 1007 / CBS 513.65 / DSM 816 / NCTC 3887 / NRRL 1 / QM 1276 / 107) TaxID=344612 RepID=A1CDX8_ASPCL|nr:glycosyl transferase, putative [Aspergillus clavatus NRRL 1]EAW12055.1 glycosyl transferase, putative [Aspergillus clavatus NRRL 1]